MTKKKLCRKSVAALLLGLLLLLSGCSKTPKIDYIAIIRGEVLTEETPLDQAIGEVLTLKLEETGEGSITVSVTAPDVCEGTLAWFDAVSDADYSDEALQAQMLDLLKGEPQTTRFTLEVQGEKILYTDEFLNAASCGVRPFYAALSARLLAEMEASLND